MADIYSRMLHGVLSTHSYRPPLCVAEYLFTCFPTHIMCGMKLEKSFFRKLVPYKNRCTFVFEILRVNGQVDKRVRLSEIRIKYMSEDDHWYFVEHKEEFNGMIIGLEMDFDNNGETNILSIKMPKKKPSRR